MTAHEMILCDIGNSRMHFLVQDNVLHLNHGEGLQRFGKEKVFYISVNVKVSETVAREAPAWIPLKADGILRSEYRGLGIDRAAACLGMEHGVVIDAGSAVTVDLMKEGVHQGGWIWPGIGKWLDCYRSISPVFDIDAIPMHRTGRLPLSTAEAVRFGILDTIAAVVGKEADGLPIVITGGDAHRLQTVLP